MIDFAYKKFMKDQAKSITPPVVEQDAGSTNEVVGLEDDQQELALQTKCHINTSCSGT